MRPIDYFDRGVNKDPNGVFVEGIERSYKFSEAKDLTFKIAQGLIKKGLEKGDSVAVCAPNDPAAVVCIFSIFRASGIWIPVNTRNDISSNAQYLTYVSTKWLFFHSSVVDEVKEMVPKLTEIKGIFCLDSSATDFPCLQEILLDYDEEFLSDQSDPFSSPEEIFSLWPTGGTTGPSKAVEMLNRNICSMYELGLRHYIGADTDEIVYLAVAPITHAAGVIMPIFTAVAGTTVLLPSFDPEEVLQTIESKKVTHIFLPPTAFYALLDVASNLKSDTSSLRQILLGASPVSPDKMKQGVDIFGPVICQCYGQVEVPMLISWLSPENVSDACQGNHPERLKSCGRVTSPTLVSILDKEGNTMPTGQEGEICCRGSLVTRAYYRNEDATKEARRFGWHHTGDVGYLDRDGFLYIVDRIKDMIITGGFNVYANEIEKSILTHEEILECAVIGIPDAKWGEAVKAIVVRYAGKIITKEKLILAIKESLGSVKTPKSIEFWESLPKTSVGKVDKKLIRERFWKTKSRNVN